MFPIEPKPGIPAKGIIDASGFLGSKEPSPGILERRFAFKPASPGKAAIFAAAAAAAAEFDCDCELDCFLLPELEVEVDEDDAPVFCEEY